MLRLVLATSIVLLTACSLSDAASADDFPIYPGVRRLAAPGMDENMPGAALVVRDAPRKVFDWYAARLKAASWEFQAKEFDSGSEQFTIVAMKGPDDSRTIATLGGGKRDDAPGTTFSVMLIGPDVSGEQFRKIPQETIKPDEPEPEEKEEPVAIPGMPTQEELARMETQMPPTPPNALQKAIIGYPKALETLLKATLNWANNTTRPNLMAALKTVPQYVKAADALRAASSAAMQNSAGGAFAGVVWSKQIMTDIVVGMIITGLEEVRDRPAAASRLQPIIKTRVRSLLDEDVRTFRVGIKEGERLAERAKQKDPGPTELDTPLTNEQIRATPETIYIPRTDLRVRSMWTPLPFYWKQVLKETATALRCWNAGCPDGCYSDDNGVKHCKAFGSYGTIPDPKPSDIHCLHILRTPESEVELLSHPMTLYCLLSLAVEVGDPAQLDAGGKITVTVDGVKLTEIPLEAIKRPFRGNVNPFDVISAPNAPPVPASQNIADQFARSIGILFGDEAEQQYRATFRMPWVVSESAGGEFHGYTFFLQVGAPVGGSSVMSNPMSYGSSNFAEYWGQLLKIAEKTHPALEREHKVVLRAEVGGIVSDGVEIKLPAAFRSLKEEVGAFSKWPGTDPDTWTFEKELGPTPPKAVPDHTVLNIGIGKEDIQTNTRKLAMVYTWLIFQDWVKALAMAGADAVMGKIGDMLKDKAFKQAEQALEKSVGYKGVTRKAVESLANKLTDVSDLPVSHGDWIQKTIGDKLKDLGFGKVTEAFGGDFVKLAQEEKEKGVITLDLTKTSLIYDVQRQIAYHRRMIRHIGDTELAFKAKVDDLKGKVEFARNAISVLSGGSLKPLLAPVIAAEKGAAASVFVSDICAIREIWNQVRMVEKYLGQANSWRK